MRIRPRQRSLGLTYSVSSTYLPPLPLFDGGVRAQVAGLTLLLLTRSQHTSPFMLLVPVVAALVDGVLNPR